MSVHRVPILVLMIFSCRLWFAVATGLCGRFPNCPFLFSSFIPAGVSSLAASISLHPAVSVIHNFCPWREFFQRAASHPVTWAFSSNFQRRNFHFSHRPLPHRPAACVHFFVKRNPIHRLIRRSKSTHFLHFQSDERTIARNAENPTDVHSFAPKSSSRKCCSV